MPEQTSSSLNNLEAVGVKGGRIQTVTPGPDGSGVCGCGVRFGPELFKENGRWTCSGCGAKFTVCPIESDEVEDEETDEDEGDGEDDEDGEEETEDGE
jgi:hypothetical protein